MRRLAFLILFAAASLHAEQPMIARWAAAIGGRQRIASIKSVHRIAARDEDGMAGTSDEWIAGMRRQELVDHVHDRSLVVFDGHHAWKRDWNGFVETLGGDDVRREAALAIVHGFGVLNGRAGEGEAAGENALRFHPDGSLPITYTFDPGSGLPTTVEVPSFDGTLTIAFSDWRDAGGIRVPFTETESNGVNTATMKLRSIALNSRQPSFTRPQDGPADTFFLHRQTPETVSFNFDNNHIMILATVNGSKPIWFLVDTGAEFSIINQSRLGELGLTTYGGLTTIGGGSSTTSGAYVEHVTYRIGEVELRNQHAAVLELRGLEKLYGMPMGGLLGWDFLSRFVIAINYEKMQLVLYPRRHSTAGEHGPRIPLVMQGEQPYFGGSIVAGGETIPAWFILDVGAADTITFTTPFVKGHDLIARVGDKQRTVQKVTAPDVAAFAPANVRALIDGVTMGGITLPHVIVNLSVASRGAYTSSAFSGNIGETILSRFPRVILDYGRNEMILEPGPETTQPFQERKSFGMTLIADGADLRTFTVTAIGATSSAARAGFRKGDVITAVDETPAAQMNLAQLKAILSMAGTKHSFHVHRGSEDVTLSATIELVPISGLT